MKRVFLLSMLMVFLGTIFAQEMDLATATAKFTEGTKLFQEDKKDEAIVLFQESADGLKLLLEEVLKPEDKAYTKYFYALALYYVAYFKKDAATIESANQEFNEAASAFKEIETVDEAYVRSKYMRALCSFRLYQFAANERNQAKMLDQAIGDFTDFLLDEDVQVHAEDFGDLRDNANYFLGYCRYMLGFINSFNAAKYSSASKSYSDAIEAFESAKKASDERLSIAAAFMEASCHYMAARLFMRVSEDDWDKFKLSSKSRNSACEGELSQSIDLLGKMISAAGTQKDMQLLGKVGKLVDMVTIGSVGEKDQLTDAMGQMTDMRNNATYGNEMLVRIADASLLSYLIFGGAAKAALSNFGRITDKSKDALFWAGWIQYIQGDYADANGKFSAFYGKIASDKSTRAKELVADGKFRQAECLFWLGVKQGNTALMSQADNIYRALENPQGEYYDHMTKDARDIVTIRRFLIGIESSLGKQTDVGGFEGVLLVAGLQLPRDAEKFLSVGRYFLQKGIETAALERQTAIKFATYTFDKVIKASVPGSVKNRARFMKGVALVKLAAAQEESEATETINQAKAVLDQCTSPYVDEAKYVVGKGYFNINAYDNATPILQQLKGKGHIRAAFTYAIVLLEKNNTSGAAKALGQIKNTIKNRTDYLYQKADLELSKIPGGAQGASGAGSLPAFKDPPMTYENLVDEEEERARKQREAKYIWQRSSSFKDIPKIDELIPDRPPETSVSLEIVIEPRKGETVLIIDEQEGLAKPVENSVYKVTLNRGTHRIKVKKKGFYLLEQELKISKSERVVLTLDKAVRYTRTSELSGTNRATAVATGENDIFAAPAGKEIILHMDIDGKKKDEIRYDELGLRAIGGMVLDGDIIVITDPQRNQIVAVPISGDLFEEEKVPVEETDSMEVDEPESEDETTLGEMAKPRRIRKKTVIAYGGETYGDVPLSRPAGIDGRDGVYYIADAGNARVLIFESSSYRKAIGEGKLSHPVDVAVGGDELYVADIGLGKILRFSTAGEFKEEIELDSQMQPGGIFVSPEGFVFVSDFARNTVMKYTPEMKLLSIAATDIVAPRGIAQIGIGPEAVVYVADAAGLTILKGGWDNTYMPE